MLSPAGHVKYSSTNLHPRISNATETIAALPLVIGKIIIITTETKGFIAVSKNRDNAAVLICVMRLCAD